MPMGILGTISEDDNSFILVRSALEKVLIARFFEILGVTPDSKQDGGIGR